MRTVERNIYLFDELTLKSRKKALQMIGDEETENLNERLVDKDDILYNISDGDLELEMDQLFSEENLREVIACNEYEFYADGRIAAREGVIYE